MKKSVSLLLILLVVVSTNYAQNKVVHFKKLQEFLPKTEFENMTRKKPTGSTQSPMGMSMSEAEVVYEYNSPDEMNQDSQTIPYTLSVKIADMSLIPGATLAYSYYQGDYESETESGYEKSILVDNKYKGRETVSNGDYKSIKREFVVDNRFIIEVTLDNSDNSALVDKAVEAIDLEGLEKIRPE